MYIHTSRDSVFVGLVQCSGAFLPSSLRQCYVGGPPLSGGVFISETGEPESRSTINDQRITAIMTRMSCTIFTPVLLVMVKVVQGQVTVKGHCPEVTTVDNFDVSRYSGVWYEQKRLFFLIEGNGICVNATYTPQEDGTVQVLNQNYNPEQVSTRIISASVG
uniref:Lipocalin/cytosolic fatty-acid binding domain-containing protein n=1 Tax=Timema genevievae TaxID=629358 RepID=A0A7R9PNP6_TIMGE|nr:unnamed protein product [Timema genevievae]